MAPERRPVHPLLRAYAWSASVSWIAGCGWFVRSGQDHGSPHPFSFILIAFGAPLVHVVLSYGTRIFGPFGENLIPPSRDPVLRGLTLLVSLLFASVFFFLGVVEMRK